MSTKGCIPWNKVDIPDHLIIDLYENQKLSGDECAKKIGCNRTSVYRKLRELGIARSNSESHKDLQVGGRNPNWKGGRYKCKSTGYIFVYLRNGERTREHRIVAESMLGRRLKKGEVVHHINGDPSDNRPQNLEIFASHAEHMKIHMTPEVASRRGKLSGKTKRKNRLPDLDVMLIRAFCKDGFMQIDLAKVFGVTTSYISHICRKTRREDVPDIPMELEMR